MTKLSPQTNPLDRLATLATTETAKRESARAANRARFPQLAEAADVLGAKVVWAQDDQGEIGRKQADPPNTVAVDLIPYTWLEASAAWAKQQAKRGRK